MRVKSDPGRVLSYNNEEDMRDASFFRRQDRHDAFLSRVSSQVYTETTDNHTEAYRTCSGRLDFHV